MRSTCYTAIGSGCALFAFLLNSFEDLIERSRDTSSPFFYLSIFISCALAFALIGALTTFLRTNKKIKELESELGLSNETSKASEA